MSADLTGAVWASMTLTSSVWFAMSGEAQLRLLKALNLRYKAGDKPTYMATGPIRVDVQLRQRQRFGFGDEWQSLSLKGGERFSPSGLSGLPHTLTLVPLDLAHLTAGFKSIRISIDNAIDSMDGFGKQLLEISAVMEDDLLSEINEQNKLVEKRELDEAKYKIEFEASEDWGAF